MSFKYLYIPSDIAEPVKELIASKSGGLNNDYLRKHAELQFMNDEVDVNKQVDGIYKHLNSSLKDIDHEKLKKIIESGQQLGSNVEIVTITLPSALNCYNTVSLYCDGNSSFKQNNKNKEENLRATNLLRACGHKDTIVIGGCFIGRSLDDERIEWERLDFLISDLNENSLWIRDAAKANFGKNLGNYSTSGALSAIQNNSLNNSSTATTTTVSNKNVDDNNELNQLNNKLYSWIQTIDEIELRMHLPADLTSKQLIIQINSNSIYIDKKNKKDISDTIEGINNVFLNPSIIQSTNINTSTLYSRINTSESTWSIANEKEGRMLTINLIKCEHKNWPSLFSNE